MRYRFHFLVLLFSPVILFSQEPDIPRFGTPAKFTINTAAFVYHVSPPSVPEYTQYFSNDFLNFGIRLTDKSYLSLGTLKNSFGDQMAMIGYRHIWHHFNDRIFVEGLYAYAGEFFFPVFSHAGDHGVYKEFKDKIGIGFAPYVYHGVDIAITSYLTLEVGFILPFISIATLQINLF